MKKTTKKAVKKKAVKAPKAEVETPVVLGDPDMPENKQRWLR